MTISLCSIFRDSTAYVDNYFSQIAKLDAALGEPVRLCLAEGDSTDGTFPALFQHIIDRDHPEDHLFTCHHGGPKFGSVDSPRRWAQIALVCNAVMEDAQALLDGPLIYVESDLLWEPATMVQLLEDLAVYPAVAPMSMTPDRMGVMRLYDLWGHRGLDGERFTAMEPYHFDVAKSATAGCPFTEIGSAGSCVVMREEVARIARFGENDCIVGLGREIRHRAKASLWLDRRVAVIHP